MPSHQTAPGIAIGRLAHRPYSDAESITSSHAILAGIWGPSNRELHTQASRALAAADADAMQPDSLIAMGVKGAPASTGGGAFSWPRCCAKDLPCRGCISCIILSWYRVIGQCTTFCRLFTCIYAGRGCPPKSLSDNHRRDKLRASLGVVQGTIDCLNVKRPALLHFQYITIPCLAVDGDVAEVQLHTEYDRQSPMATNHATNHGPSDG
jgi:hypothetical protein